MKKVTFLGYENIYRKDILILSPEFYLMIDGLKSVLMEKKGVALRLGRISDQGVSMSDPINFFDINFDEDILKMSYFGDHHDSTGENALKETKSIRLDNPFGEIPILGSFKEDECLVFWNLGDNLLGYKDFIKESRNLLKGHIGEKVQLSYKNDDGTFSVVIGFLKEVNKGNILMEDTYEVLVKENKTSTASTLLRRLKNHRFVSENGYLVSVSSPFSSQPAGFDDGLTFGESPTWKFLLPKKEELSLSE